jgi:hypothetical protein
VDLFEPMPVQGLGRPLWKVLSDDRLGLVPSVTHGFLEITTARSIENEPFGAVYDVSGILPGLTSVRAFNEAIEEVAWTGAAWAESATTMTIHRAGLLVAWCNETRHRELQQLLAAQRDQMRADVLSAEDLAVVETRYYRLKTETAADLLRLIPELIAPDTWRSEARPEAVGIIRQVALGPLYGPQEKLMQGGGFFQVPAATESATETTTRPSREKYTALVVRQTRRVQITIQRMLDALLNGNPGDDWDDVTVPTGEVPLD